jgi:hypothetical protein
MARIEHTARPSKPSARPGHLAGLALLMLLPIADAQAAPPTTFADRLHARALESFRQGRFPEAYGRFIGLANAGHPASARYALWMCEQGLPLFGKDWDCAPHEMQDWARAAGMAPGRGEGQHGTRPPSHGNAARAAGRMSGATLPFAPHEVPDRRRPPAGA